MKNLIFAITLILSINVCAQDGLDYTNVFVRVYDFQGKKISKGKIFSISETTLQLNKKGESMKIPLSSIGSIKTKHSSGNNILVGAASGAATMALLGAATADDSGILGYTAGEGAAVGALFGGITGAAIGGITILFKNSKSYEINGDMVKWNEFKEMIINK